MITDSFGKDDLFIVPGHCVVIRFEGWGSRPQYDHSVFIRCSQDGDISCVIPWVIFLFVGVLMFFINNDQSDIFKGANMEERAPMTMSTLSSLISFHCE